MIRRTVATAFGLPPKSRVEPPAESAGREDVSRLKQVDGIFKELRQALVRSRRGGAKGGAEKVTAIQPELEGQEFHVEGQPGVLVFRNTMNGQIWILEREAGGSRRLAVLTVHPDEAGVRRLIEKPAGPGRAPFHFTSIPAVVESVLGRNGAPGRTPPRSSGG